MVSVGNAYENDQKPVLRSRSFLAAPAPGFSILAATAPTPTPESIK
jgi:hypothetical protein